MAHGSLIASFRCPLIWSLPTANIYFSLCTLFLSGLKNINCEPCYGFFTFIMFPGHFMSWKLSTEISPQYHYLFNDGKPKIKKIVWRLGLLHITELLFLPCHHTQGHWHGGLSDYSPSLFTRLAICWCLWTWVPTLPRTEKSSSLGLHGLDTHCGLHLSKKERFNEIG